MPAQCHTEVHYAQEQLKREYTKAKLLEFVPPNLEESEDHKNFLNQFEAFART